MLSVRSVVGQMFLLQVAVLLLLAADATTVLVLDAMRDSRHEAAQRSLAVAERRQLTRNPRGARVPRSDRGAPATGRSRLGTLARRLHRDHEPGRNSLHPPQPGPHRTALHRHHCPRSGRRAGHGDPDRHARAIGTRCGSRQGSQRLGGGGWCPPGSRRSTSATRSPSNCRSYWAFRSAPWPSPLAERRCSADDCCARPTASAPPRSPACTSTMTPSCMPRGKASSTAPVA